VSETKARKKKAAAPASATFDAAFPVGNIVLREENVRSEYTNMDESGASIEAEGILQPLTLVALVNDQGEATGKGELVAGYRRYFAAQKASLTTVPVCFVDANEHRRHRLAMIENLQRVDMNPMDRATGIQKMQANEGIDQKGVARSLGVSEGYVSQHLALLKLPSKVQTALRNGKLEMTHARTLGRLKDEELILGLLKDAQGMTAADLTNRVDHLLAKEKEKAAKASAAAPRKKKSAASAEEGGEKVSLAEQYAAAVLAPLNKTDLRSELQARAEKMTKAKTEASRTEHKFVLKGLEIAAGLK
jgi:ParB/RepB/Spo0J family partition protein